MLLRLPRPLHGLIVPLIIIVIWQVIGSLHVLSPTVLPSPWDIGRQFVNLGLSGELFEHLGISMYRAALGFLLGGTTGLLIGLSTGLAKMVERTLDPSLQMLRTIPLLALIPLFILWFGVGEFSKVLMML